MAPPIFAYSDPSEVRAFQDLEKKAAGWGSMSSCASRALASPDTSQPSAFIIL